MVTVKRGDKGTEWAVDDRHSRSSSFPPWPEGTGPRHEGYEGASDTRNEPFSRGMLGSDSHPSRGTTSMSDRSETEGAPLLRGSLRSHSGTLRLEDIIIENLLSFPLSCASLWTCLSSDLVCLLDSRHGPQGRWEDRELKSVEIPLFHLSLWSYPSSCEWWWWK